MKAEQVLGKSLHQPGVEGTPSRAAPPGEPAFLILAGNGNSPHQIKKANQGRIFWLLAGAAILGTCLHFLHEFQVRRNAHAFIRLADRAEEDGQRIRAAGYLSGYLAYVPEDTQILARYAMLLDDLAASPKSRRRAVQAMEQVLQREPRHYQIRCRVARDEVQLHQFTVAAKHLEILLDSSPHDAELEQLLGECYASNGDFGKAVVALENAIQHARSSIEAYTQLASLLRTRLDQSQRATRLLDDMIAANKNSAAAYLARGKFRVEDGAFDKAAQDLEMAGTLAPGNIDVLLAQAELARYIGWRQELWNQLRTCLKNHPLDERLHVALARLALSSGHRDEGIASLRQGLQVAPGQADLLAMLAETRIEDGRTDEAADLIARMLKAEGSPALADYLRSRILLQKQDFAGALKLLESVRSHLEIWPDLACRAELDLGQCYERLDDSQEQLTAYRRGVGRDPTSARARHALASTLLTLGMYDEAAREFRKTLGLPKPPEGVLAGLAQALLERNLQLAPAKRDWTEIANVVAQAEAASPGSIPAIILRAQVVAGRESAVQACAFLESACRRKPDAMALQTALALLLQKSGRADAALRVLTEAEQRFGDCLELRLAQANYWSGQDHVQAAKAISDLGRNVDKFAPEARLRLLRALARTAYEVRDFVAAETCCAKIIELLPGDRYSRVLLFDLALQTGRNALIDRVLTDLRRIEGENGVLWKCGEATRLVLLVKRGRHSARLEARARLAEVSLRWPSWSYVSLLGAMLDEMDGNEEDAIDHYLQAIDQGDQRPEVLYRAARLLYDHRRYRQAQQVLRKLESRLALKGDHARLGAEIALRTHDPKHALELSARTVAANSTDYRDYLWLAGIQESAGMLAEARESLQKAVKHGKNIPDAWAGLVQFVARTQSPEKADVIIEEARAQLAPERVPLALARCYEKIGRLDQAQEQYQALLAIQPDDVSAHQALASFYLRENQSSKAEPHLRRIIDPGSIAPAEQVAWARRQLTLLLSAGNSPARFDEAMALIDANLAADSGSVPDQRARALVLGSQSSTRREAIRLLEETMKRQPFSLDEQCRLAQLYETAGDRTRAREQFIGLVAVQRPNPAHLALYTRFLAKQGELREASRWLGRLEKLEPNGPETIETAKFVREKEKVRAAQNR